ncbi:MAG: hypothetical protein HQL72_07600 [Magnetococcales bacterium]|nr:hypothetical protein [Magnetococcales bacterium]
MTRIQLFFILFILLLPLMLIQPKGGEAQTEQTEAESAALQTYKTFANAFMSGQFETALALSIGAAHQTVLRKIELINKGEDQITSYQDPLFLIVSEEHQKEGQEVTIHGVQVLQNNSKKGMYQPPQLHRQYLTLVLQEKGWKIRDFKDDQEKCCQP